VEAASWGNISGKKIAKGAMMAGAVGVESAQIATHTGFLALMMGGAAAASATGIGLAAVGGAITVGGMALGAKSALSTWHHIQALESIYVNRNGMKPPHACDVAPPWLERNDTIHNYIADTVLPWIIQQKKTKKDKKVASTFGAGLGVSLWSAGRWVYKGIQGSLGQMRSHYAWTLAKHLLTHNCRLAYAIVTALFGGSLPKAVLQQDMDTVTLLLQQKMKSV
jgi:hypothetical protein